MCLAADGRLCFVFVQIHLPPSIDFAIILRVEMNFHADIKSLLKQTDPNAIYRVSHSSRMIHHPAKARAITQKQ